jgi:hypothetical protein
LVRVGFAEDDVLRTQLVIEVGTARELAEQWRQAVTANGGFQDVLAP